jgi:hypothetical protein
MSEALVRQWLDARAATANSKNLAAHLDLISRNVALTGVEGHDVIGYDDWAAACTREFKEGVLKRVDYQGLKLVEVTGSRIVFRTWETVEGNDGTVNSQGIEVALQLEDDGKWRVVQERILSPVEAARDGLLS